jgi:hypothetical protein
MAANGNPIQHGSPDAELRPLVHGTDDPKKVAQQEHQKRMEREPPKEEDPDVEPRGGRA